MSHIPLRSSTGVGPWPPNWGKKPHQCLDPDERLRPSKSFKTREALGSDCGGKVGLRGLQGRAEDTREASEKNQLLEQKSWRGGRGSSDPWSTVHLLSSSFCELQDNTDEWSAIKTAGNIKRKV